MSTRGLRNVALMKQQSKLWDAIAPTGGTHPLSRTELQRKGMRGKRLARALRIRGLSIYLLNLDLSARALKVLLASVTASSSRSSSSTDPSLLVCITRAPSDDRSERRETTEPSDNLRPSRATRND